MLKEYVIKASKVLLAITMGGMFMVVLLQVVARYVLKISFFWSEELARYLMIWTGILGAALGVSQGVHTSVQWFLRFFPGRAKDLVLILANILVLGFAVCGFIGAMNLMPFLKFQSSTALRISMVYPFLAFPIGFGVMIIFIVSDLIDSIKRALQKNQ